MSDRVLMKFGLDTMPTTTLAGRAESRMTMTRNVFASVSATFTFDVLRKERHATSIDVATVA